MNQHGMAGPPMGMIPIMQQPSPQQMQGPPHPGHPQNQAIPQPKQTDLDNISKVKSLVGPLRESLSVSSFVFITNELHITNGSFVSTDNIKNGRAIASTQ